MSVPCLGRECYTPIERIDHVNEEMARHVPNRLQVSDWTAYP
jgi:hypothetical protein